MMLRTPVFFAIALFPLVGCGGDEVEAPPATPATYAIETALESAVLPSVRAFDEAARALEDEVQRFCAGPSSAGLQGAQAGWRELSESWSRLVPYKFGPLDDDLVFPNVIFIESMRQRGIDYTQTVREAVAVALTSSTTLDRAYFEDLRFNEVGILALEVLLFESSEPENPQEPAAIVADYSGQPRKCRYLVGVLGLLVDRAESVRDGWEVGFEATGGEPYADAMQEASLPNGAEPVALLLVSVQEHLTYLIRRKLEALLDARLADHFYPNLEATLEEVDQLLTGGPAGASIVDVMQARGAASSPVLGHLEDARASARAEDRAALTDAVRFLEDDFRRAIPDGLGVELSLSFSDGD